MLPCSLIWNPQGVDGLGVWNPKFVHAIHDWELHLVDSLMDVLYSKYYVG
jgi:hypothetical protein